MTAVVTGASGFVGGALARHWAAQGRRVVCPLRRPCPQLDGLANLRTVHVALDDPRELAAALQDEKPQVVVHLAASGVRPEERGLTSLAAGHVGVLAAVLQAAQSWPLARFVHAGSVAELGAGSGEPLDETAALSPISSYGAAKAAATVFALGTAKATGLPLVVGRLFGVYGIGEAPQRLLPHLAQRLVRGQPAELTSGEQIRDFTWIADVCAALQALAEAELPALSTWHVCSGQGRSVRQVGARMAELAGADPALLQWGALPQRADEPARLVGDPRRLQAATGWRARTGLDEALQRMLAFERGRLG